MVCITILIGPLPTIVINGTPYIISDYQYYRQYWAALLEGQNPYNFWIDSNHISCLYPVGFLVFAGLFYIHTILPKVFFCLVWMYTAVIINKICKEYNLTKNSTLLYSLGLVALNPYYWQLVLVIGNVDVVVGLCVLLSVYCIKNSKQIKSGIYTLFAFLIKFIGIILFFPVVFTKKKINWKLGVIFISGFCGMYLLGFILWGQSIFNPFLNQLLREPEGTSISFYISSIFGINFSYFSIILSIIGIVFVIIFFYLKNNEIATYSILFIIYFILILPVFNPQYTLWYFPLVIYWSIIHDYALMRTITLYFPLILILLSFREITPIFSILGFIISLSFMILIYLNRTRDKITENNKNS